MLKQLQAVVLLQFAQVDAQFVLWIIFWAAQMNAFNVVVQVVQDARQLLWVHVLLVMMEIISIKVFVVLALQVVLLVVVLKIV